MFKVGQKVTAVCSDGQRVPGEVVQKCPDSLIVRFDATHTFLGALTPARSTWSFYRDGTYDDWHLEPAEPVLPQLTKADWPAVQELQRAHGLPVQELPKPVPFHVLLWREFMAEKTNQVTAKSYRAGHLDDLVGFDEMAAALRELGPDALEAHAREMREAKP